MSKHFIVYILSLFAVLMTTSVSAFTVKLQKGGLFCFYKELKADEQFGGTYVVSGYDEASIGVKIQNFQTKEVFYLNEKKKEGTWDFKAPKEAEYKTCFKNFVKKDTYISLDLYAAGDEKNTTSLTSESLGETINSLRKAVQRVKKVRTNLGFQKTRSNIHERNLKSLNSQIEISAIFKVVVLLSVSIAQVYILTGYFRRQKKVYV